VKSHVGPELVREAERYCFRFTCEACAHFAPDTTRCAHEYPNEAHHGVELGERDFVEFCKEFELA